MTILKTPFDAFLACFRTRSVSRVQRVRDQAPKARRLKLESLEDRDLLSATSEIYGAFLPQTATSPVYESPTITTASSTVARLSATLDDLLTADGQNPKKLTEDYIFGLSSLPTSTYTIYLDFNGHVNSGGTYWQRTDGGYGTITTPKYTLDSNANSFSNDELKSIYEIWLRVSEDFAPFNVNVTTKEPTLDALVKNSSKDASYGVRVCIGGSYSDWLNTSAGGIAYVGCFDSSDDTPAYVFSNNLYSTKAVAETISHEVGHTLGLAHDGYSKGAYYPGADGWAPIMGTGDYQPLTQWSKGEYVGAKNKEDDLAIITTKNGFGYRSDDVGDSVAKAKTISSGYASGIIERNTDVDFFKFQYGGGVLNLNVGGIDEITNLDALVKLYDASGKLLQTFDPTDSLSVTVETSGLAVGTYYLSVQGTGLKLNGKTIYTNYGSLGRYTIAISEEARPPIAPSDLTLGEYDPTTGRVSLEWKDNSDNETGFRVEFWNNINNEWRLSQIMKANETSRVATGVKTDALYQFRVCAFSGDQYSEWAYSEILDTSVVVAPSDLTLGEYDATTQRVSFDWKDNSDYETGFRVEYWNDINNEWRLSQVMKANATSRVATGVYTNAKYQFRVCALYGDKRSEWTYSEILDTSVKFAAPSDLTLGEYDPTTRRVSLSWKDNSNVETGFRVEFWNDVNNEWRLAQIMDANVTSRVATRVNPNMRYQFRVCALCGNERSEWTYSEILNTSVKKTSSSDANAVYLTNASFASALFDELDDWLALEF